VERLVSRRFLAAVGGLAATLFAVGLALWLFERRRKNPPFDEGPSRGLFTAFWWAAVTMTTVGYGDAVPRTPGGRAVALAWMFGSILVISSFTATLTHSLTLYADVHQLHGPDDLRGVAVGTVAASTSVDWLVHERLPFDHYPHVGAALAGLMAGEVDAVVYDAPILRFLVRHRHRDTLRVSREEFARQHYGLAFPQSSPLREPVNQALLREVGSMWWKGEVLDLLGE